MARGVIVVGARDDATTTKRRTGEVLTVQEDDHVFAPHEVANPQWRVFEIPGLPASALHFLLSDKALSQRAYRFPVSTWLFEHLQGDDVLTLDAQSASDLFDMLEDA